MKATVSRVELARALDLVSAAVSQVTTLDLLKKIALWYEGGRLRVAGSDLILYVESDMPASGDGEAFSVAVPALVLAPSIKAMVADDVTFELKDDMRCYLTCGRVKQTLPGEGTDMFPILGALPPRWSFRAPARQVARCLKRVRYAAAPRESGSTQLENVRVVFNSDTEIEFAATDRVRGALAWLAVEGAVTPDTNESWTRNPLLIPAGAVTLAMKVLEDEEAEAEVEFTGGYILLRTSRTRMMMPLGEGPPNLPLVSGLMQRAQEAGAYCVVMLTKDVVNGALRRALVALPGKELTNGIEDDTLALAGATTEGGVQSLTVYAGHPAGVRNEEDIDGDFAGEGEEFFMPVRYSYLKEAVEPVAGSGVILSLPRPGVKMPVILASDDGDERYAALFMQRTVADSAAARWYHGEWRAARGLAPLETAPAEGERVEA